MDATQVSRRAFLAGAASLGGAVLLEGPPAFARRRVREPFLTEGAFGCGVAAGDPATDGAVLWTRVDGVARTGRLRVEVARDAGFRHVVDEAVVRAPAVRDFTVRHRARGLRPGEDYWYRFHHRGGSSPVGRFRTLRPADSTEPVRIGVFSCQEHNAGWYTAHAALAREDVDLVVCLGDYIYEHNYYDGPAARRDTTGANHDGDVQTLAEYREKYRFYKADADLQAMHAAHAYVSIWDDHEVEDNYAGDHPDSVSSDPSRFANDNRTPRRVPFAERRRAGYLSFFEYTPRMRPRGDRIYGRLPLGRHASLLLTDERQYRAPQPCRDRYAIPCPDADAPGLTMLGSAQKAWFKEALAAEPATWKLWANELMVMSLDFPALNHLNLDAWDGYRAERREILEHCRARGVRNLVALTGDVHTFFAGTVTTEGTIAGHPVGTEFVGGSITSHGLEALTEAGNAALLAGNPHFAYADVTRRGYMTVEAAADALTVRYRCPDSVLAPASAVRTVATFRVGDGETAVHRV